MISGVATTFVLSLLALGNAAPAPAPQAAGTVRITNANSKNAVSGRYIVVLKDGLDTQTVDKHTASINSFHTSSSASIASQDGSKTSGIKSTYAFNGFNAYSGEFDKDTLAEISKSSDVAYIEADTIYKISTTQDSAPWGIARISQREALTGSKRGRPRDDGASYNYEESASGKGVTVYVVDTGINIKHNDFEGRASWGTNFADDEDDDLNGHGSHCAGTIAGATFGVAKSANVVAVKVMDAQGQGSTSQILDGLQWVGKQVTKAKGKNKSVVSMSLGGEFSSTLNKQAAALVKAGITVVVAAGNEAQDSNNVSPASETTVITVAASDKTDTFASFSNFGTAVDVIAPGVNITSAWMGSEDAENTISGTSMAAPHIAGLSACFISSSSKGMTPNAVAGKISELSTPDAISSVPEDTKNAFAFNGFSGGSDGGSTKEAVGELSWRSRR